ncbi:MAG: acyl-CoA dehydrogenase family protein [Clostridiales bacterium]
MEFSLSQDQKDICEFVYDFATKNLNKDIFKDDEKSNFPIEKWKDCGEFGIHGLPIPEEYGGQGYNMLDTALAVESLAYGCMDEGLVFGICAHMLACAIPINIFGSQEQKQKYLPNISKGKIICGNAISEAEAGSDLKSMKTKIEKTDKEYILSGNKIFVSNGPVADLFIVYAKHKDGMDMLDTSAVIVERGNNGLSNGQKFEKMGIRSCQLGEIVLTECNIPIENLIGREKMGMLVFNYSMLWERIIMSAYHLGSMRQQYKIVLDYANKRKQFNNKIIKFDSVSEKLIDMKMRIELSELLLYKTCWKFDNDLLKKEDPSVCKLFISESKVKSSLEAVQIFGAYGYLKESMVEKQLRDSIASKMYSGTSEIHKRIIAESLVK